MFLQKNAPCFCTEDIKSVGLLFRAKPLCVADDIKYNQRKRQDIADAAEFLHITHREDNQHNQRQHIGDIRTDRRREFEPLARVGFTDEVIPTPTVAGSTEQQIDHRAKRQQVVGNDEVLHILNVADVRERDAVPQVEAEDTRNGDHKNEHQIEQDGLFAAPAPQIHAELHNILEHRNDGRERRKGHEHEEQRAPQTSSGHLIENIRQGYENKRRSLTCIDMECRSSRENNQAGHERYKGIEHRDADRLAGQAAVATDVRAENRQRADAERQGKERLTHCGKDALAKTAGRLIELRKIRFQVERQALRCAFKRYGAEHQNNHNCKQRNHHDLVYLFYAALQSRANKPQS